MQRRSYLAPILQKSIDLYAQTPEVAKAWVNVLDHLVKTRREQRAYFDENEWLTVVQVLRL